MCVCASVSCTPRNSQKPGEVGRLRPAREAPKVDMWGGSFALSQTGFLLTARLGVFRVGFSFFRVGWTHQLLGRVLEPLRRQSHVGQESFLGFQMSAQAMNTPLLGVPHDAAAECQRSRSRYELYGNTYEPLRGGGSCPMGKLEGASALRRAHVLKYEQSGPFGINDLRGLGLFSMRGCCG